MPSFCLTKDTVQKFKRALKERELDPFKMASMTSAERRELLSKYVGEHAKEVNALFESKLLLKNQKAGYQSWVKKVAGITPEVKRDLLSRIERMDAILSPTEEQSFLQDLAEARLGFGVTEEEAKTISDLSRKVTELKDKVDIETDKPTKENIEYGAAKEALNQYVLSLKGVKGTNFVNPLKGEGILGKAGAIGTDVDQVIKLLAQNSRAFKATFDNSLWGNQGIRVALDYKYSDVWAKNFIKSFKDIAKVLTAKDPIKTGNEIISATRAEIYSRKNSLNGRYEMSTPETSKLDLGVREEDIPESSIDKIPILRRFAKAADVAYEAGAIRLRADVADKMYATAEKNGVNMNDKFEVGSRNVVTNSITGRGRIKVPNIVNDAVFSVKYFKSQLDFLTVNAFDKLSPSARKQAASNILNIVALTAIILGISKALDKDSTDFDPRSPKFGKIQKDGITLINLTPGYGSILNLISRILTQSTKNRAGIVKKIGEGYGAPNGMDLFWDFTENKASPMASIIRDLVRQKTFEGNKPFSKEDRYGINYFTSISITTSEEILKDKSGDSLLKAIAIGLGILGTGAGSSNYPTRWENSTSKELIGFKAKVGDKKFKQANDDFNAAFSKWQNKVSSNPSYQKLSDDEKQKVITAGKSKIQKDIEKQYGYSYKAKRSKSNDRIRKSLLP